jgi:hypothetical protein
VVERLSPADQAFDSAIDLLDSGEGPKAEALLELVIGAARAAPDVALLARACCVLGEWLHGQGRLDEARAWLTEVTSLGAEGAAAISYEQARARRLLECSSAGPVEPEGGRRGNA